MNGLLALFMFIVMGLCAALLSYALTIPGASDAAWMLAGAALALFMVMFFLFAVIQLASKKE